MVAAAGSLLVPRVLLSGEIQACPPQDLPTNSTRKRKAGPHATAVGASAGAAVGSTGEEGQTDEGAQAAAAAARKPQVLPLLALERADDQGGRSPLAELWPGLAKKEKGRVASLLGRCIAQLHMRGHQAAKQGAEATAAAGAGAGQQGLAQPVQQRVGLRFAGPLGGMRALAAGRWWFHDRGGNVWCSEVGQLVLKDGRRRTRAAGPPPTLSQKQQEQEQRGSTTGAQTQQGAAGAAEQQQGSQAASGPWSPFTSFLDHRRGDALGMLRAFNPDVPGWLFEQVCCRTWWTHGIFAPGSTLSLEHRASCLCCRTCSEPFVHGPNETEKSTGKTAHPLKRPPAAAAAAVQIDAFLPRPGAMHTLLGSPQPSTLPPLLHADLTLNNLHVALPAGPPPSQGAPSQAAGASAAGTEGSGSGQAPGQGGPGATGVSAGGPQGSGSGNDEHPMNGTSQAEGEGAGGGRPGPCPSETRQGKAGEGSSHGGEHLLLLDWADAGHGDPLWDWVVLHASVFKFDPGPLHTCWQAYRAALGRERWATLWPDRRGKAGAAAAEGAEATGSEGQAQRYASQGQHADAQAQAGSTASMPLSRVAMCYLLLSEEPDILSKVWAALSKNLGSSPQGKAGEKGGASWLEQATTLVFGPLDH